jgi:hypothetical protein
MPALLTYARIQEPVRQLKTSKMTLEHVHLSLQSPIAKVWPKESPIRPDGAFQLWVPRWEQSEREPGGMGAGGGPHVIEHLRSKAP